MNISTVRNSCQLQLKLPGDSSSKYPPTLVERIQFYLDPGTGGDFGGMCGYFGPMGFTPGSGPSQRLCPFQLRDQERGDMANGRLSMRKIKEVLRLKYEAGLSNRAIAKSCGICHKTVKEYLTRARASGLSWPLADDLSDKDLEALLFPGDPGSAGKVQMPDMAWVSRELKRKGVTRYLLWREFSQGAKRPCSYSRFCQAYKEWSKKADPVMRQDHKAGEKMFVDYAGLKMEVVDPHTWESRKVPVFVAVLGASSYQGEGKLVADSSWLMAITQL